MNKPPPTPFIPKEIKGEMQRYYDALLLLPSFETEVKATIQSSLKLMGTLENVIVSKQAFLMAQQAVIARLHAELTELKGRPNAQR